MRRMTHGARHAAIPLVAAALAFAGCDNKPKGMVPGVASAEVPTPRQSAEAFLAALGEGTVGPDQLTPVFRQALTRPKADAGAEARDYLSRFMGAKFIVLEEAKFGDAIVLRGRAESPGQKDSFSVRLVKEMDGYKADWLHRSERMGMNFQEPAEPDLAAAQDTVRNFVDIILGGDVRLAHALMTPAWKTKLAPATQADVRDGYDHSPGFLTQTTRSWRGDSVGYSLVKAELNAAKDEATIRIEIEARGAKTPFVLKATRIGGQWLVAAFDVR